MGRFWSGLAIALLLAGSIGCASQYLVDESYTYRGCDASRPDAQEISMGAMVAALERRRGWTIDSVDLAQSLIVARACRGDDCISVDFRVLPNGDVDATRSPEQYVSGKWGRVLQGWIQGLEREFGAERCKPADELKRRLVPYRR